MIILNLTQHLASYEQRAAGVIDLPFEPRAELLTLLTFINVPTTREIEQRAYQIGTIAALNASGEDRRDEMSQLPEGDSGGFATHAMIGGALWLMAPLALELREHNIKPVFAFSQRETEEATLDDGSVRKIVIFRHRGFIDAI